MRRHLSLFAACALFAAPLSADSLSMSVKTDYDRYLAPLFEHFHRNPELSTVENETAARMALELSDAGFDVTENVGGTGLVAMLENGDGPLIMMRADMDGLPVKEASGLEYASVKQQVSPITGETVYTMHACGHDVHITALVGTARQMVQRQDEWSGTLMLVVQPAEETGAGAKAMRADDIWTRFGTPDAALAFHVSANDEAGVINVSEGSPYAGADSVDIIVHGVGGHGASPHQAIDPIVLGAQIVLGLQTLVSRELPPRDAGVVTVGSFHAGTKHNIISDRAHLQLTVRNTKPETRELLLGGIERIAKNLGRAAGLPEDRLPEVIVSEDSVPPTQNTPALAQRLKGAWANTLGTERVVDIPSKGMGAEDFPFFTVDPSVDTVYWRVGGTPKAAFIAAENGGPPVPGHHSPFFKIEPETSVRAGIESTVVALLELMPPAP
ncbi:MAG: amidohydrolase [Xanthomonadales bacterium]|jgi:hippurate hydrolase|nr:amidohydrolase [Xanthomonadales bacterium]